MAEFFISFEQTHEREDQHVFSSPYSVEMLASTARFFPSKLTAGFFNDSF
jgi:hypothetical protein